MIYAIFVAILVVSVFKEDTVAAWNNSRNVVKKTPQHKSTICFLLSKVSVMMSLARYQSLENSESCIINSCLN